MVVRRYDQRNTSDRSSAYAALISDVRNVIVPEDVEQFDDIRRNSHQRDDTIMKEGLAKFETKKRLW